MAKKLNKFNRRMLTKRSNFHGVEPTIPGSSAIDQEDHTKGGWLDTDIYRGELFMNIADEMIWSRSNYGIFQIYGSPGSPGIPETAGYHKYIIPDNTFTIGEALAEVAGVWQQANTSDEEHTAQGMVIDITAGEATLIRYGDMELTAHGYTVGEWYHLSDSGSFILDTSAQLIEQVMFYVKDTDNIEINIERPIQKAPTVSPPLPIGSIIQFVTTTPPEGYLFCNGSTFDELVYPQLFSILGNSNVLPDLRSEFIRGATTDANIDFSRKGDSTATPNANFTVSGSTNTTGNHTHTANWPVYRTSGGNSTPTNWGGSTDTTNAKTYPKNVTTAGNHTHTWSGNVGGGDTETAPVHVYLAYHIKALNSIR